MTTDTTTAMRMALEALEQIRNRADSANGIGHLYEGDCPDPGQPDARDPGCPACKTMDASAAAIAALREAIERDGWQPIETAPKDGRLLLLWKQAPYSTAEVMWWQPDVSGWVPEYWNKETDGFCGELVPTHWRPLPPAPKD